MPEWREEIRHCLRTARLTGAAEAEIVEELVQHLEDRYAELRSRGETEADARSIALMELEDDRALGDRVRLARSEQPDSVTIGADPRGGGEGGVRGVLAGVVADTRVGLRMLRRSPGFTVVATLVIALGIGASTAVFSVVNSMLFQPLPGVASPDRLAMLYTSDFSGPLYGASSYPDYEAVRESGAFAGITVYRPASFSIVVNDEGTQVSGEVVSADYFEVLGVRLQAGRFFLAEESGSRGSVESVVISDALWRTRMNGSPDVVGAPLRVNGRMLTIVGVAPRDFGGVLRGVRADLWLPAASPAAVGSTYSNRGNRGFMAVARLHPDATLEATQARLNVLARELHAEYPTQWTDVADRGRVLTLVPESDSRVPQQERGAVLGMVGLMIAVVGVVLLIACSNVANLLLTRASVRRAELGVRLSLGATRGRIVRQLLAESVLLASLGGVAGVVLAVWLVQSLGSIPLPFPVTLDVHLDARVIAFSAVITVLTGILFGLAPALHGSRAPAPLMREGARAGSRSHVRNVLVVVQMAASVVLLVGGALFLRSLLAAQRIDIGIATENVALMPFDLRTEGYTPERASQFFAELQQQAAAIPGVQSVTLAQRVPLDGRFARRSVIVDGHTRAEGEDMEVNYNGVSPGYFDALGIRLLRGRAFTNADREGAPGVIIVNEAFARRFWPGREAIGQRVGLLGPDGPMSEVIGVVPDGKYRSLTEEPLPYMYYAHLQMPSPAMLLQVRTAIDPGDITDALRDRVRAIAPMMPMPEITTLRSQVGLATMPQRIAAIVLALLGVIALGIAAIGLYGVVSYVVAQRTHEFGIRTALGAPSGAVARMVVMQGLRLALVGVAIGALLALVLAQTLSTMLLVSPSDPLAIAGAAFLLTGVAAFASWLPARRATRVDPLTALRG